MKKILSWLFLFLFCLSLINYKCLASEQFKGDNSEQQETTTKKVVYLTFDDGPGGKVTEKMLDTLKENNVKATFFVIGDLAKNQPELIKRMYDEGHSIGLHTYTHKKEKIYSSPENFIKENLLAQQTIEEITGFKPYILRFPFGSNNANYKLSQTMVNTLHDNGIRIYDWNVDSTDGMNPGLDPYRIAEKAKSNLPNAVVLMHCGHVNKKSAEALPLVVKYYKDRGYEFKTIDETTPEIYRLKNKK